MRSRHSFLKTSFGIIVLLFFFGALAISLSGTEAITKTMVMNERGERHLILRDVRVEEVHVRIASSEHFVLEWTEREVAGEEGEVVVGLMAQPAVPKSYSLSQNHPNPFNPSTTIRIEIPADTGQKDPVRLDVFDLRGRLIRTLMEDARDSGAFTVHWDGRNNHGGRVASGIYLYRLVAGDFTAVRKMVLMK